jgi:hypothetical protein
MKSKRTDSDFPFAFAVAAASAAVLGNSWHLPWLAEDSSRRVKLVHLSAGDLAAQAATKGGGKAVEK